MKARAYERKIWVLDGVLDHDLPFAQLEQVAAKHAKIDHIPKGYFYPELFAGESKPILQNDERSAGAQSEK